MKLLREHPWAAGTAIAFVILAAVFVSLIVLADDDAPEADDASGVDRAAGGADVSTAPGEAQPGGIDGDGRTASADGLAELEELRSGEADGASEITVDIDGDGRAERIVIRSGEGDTRPLDWILLDDGEDGALLFSRLGVVRGEVSADGPRIVETEAVYDPGDEPCCPSRAKRTIYVWQEGGLVVSRVEAAPAGRPAP